GCVPTVYRHRCGPVAALASSAAVYQHQRTHVADSSVQRCSGVFDQMVHRLERFSFAREMPTLHCMAGTKAYCQDAVPQSANRSREMERFGLYLLYLST